jgi:hypothetical protein
MDRPMQLALLGQSGVGKTTFIASVYGLMQAEKGLGLAAESGRDHEELMVAFRAIQDGRYPPATAARSEYNFALTHADERVFPFLWTDYRGGALRDRSESADAVALQQDVDDHDLTGARRPASRLFKAVQSAGLLLIVGVVLLTFLGFVLGVRLPGMAAPPEDIKIEPPPRLGVDLVEGKPHTLVVPEKVRTSLGICKGRNRSGAVTDAVGAQALEPVGG